jgi:plastocyanin
MRMQRSGVRRDLLSWSVALTALAVTGCKGSNSNPTPPPTVTNVITITANGVSPKAIAVSPGSQVTFTNNDTRTHDMQSDPHPEHNDCPELAQVGFLRVGESRQSGNLNAIRTCGYHDNSHEEDSRLRGTITIQ